MKRSMNTPTRSIATSLGNALAVVTFCAASGDRRQTFLAHAAARVNQRGWWARILLILGISGILFVQTAGALSFPDFVQCVGASGHDPVCKLDAGIYPVSQTISLGRSNITIEGTVLGSLLETTLQRAAGFDDALISDVNAIGTTLKSVTIRDLTFDGNRDANLSPYFAYNPDVSIFVVQKLRVENCTFINSPNIGLALYGAGTGDVIVDRCYFGNPVVFGMWSDATVDTTNITNLDCPNIQFVNNVILKDSVFENAGESGLLAEVTNLQILGNVFTNNHSNTIPFDDSGGQIDLTVCTKNALIWKNTFQDGSASPNGTVADGVELHGTYISLIDNTVKNNSGDGINMDGVQHISIKNSDPTTGSFGNGRSGIAIAHSDPTFRITEWISIDSAIATGNVEYGIWSDTSNTTPTEPVNHLTIENTCLSDNTLSPTFFANLGPDVKMKNNKVSGCGRK
jgi:Right handed beta helix region